MKKCPFILCWLVTSQERFVVFEEIQKSAGMETRPTSSGYVGRVSIPAALGLMDSPNATESLWRALESLRIPDLYEDLLCCSLACIVYLSVGLP